MVVPVALRAKALGLCEPLILALTTAAPVARAAGLPTIGIKDFLTAADEPWLAMGEKLAAQLANAPVDLQESAAYLGLSYADLVAEHGEPAAAAIYEKSGRQAFLPIRLMQRVLGQLRPQLICATNSPRAERAAVVAAGMLGIPSACVVDLFAIDEKRWIGLAGFADRVCVLNESVRKSLLAMQRKPDEVLVTGNPAFDRLFEPAHALRASATRQRLQCGERRVLLWASQHEPSHHPWRQQAGDSSLPGRVLEALIAYVGSRGDWLLAVRPHPSEADPVLPDHPRIRLTGRDWPLTELLYACDAVCTLTSTVGLEAHLIGKPVVQVSGSMFEDAAPFVAMGIALPATLDSLPAVLDDLPQWAPTSPAAPVSATDQVVAVLQSLTSPLQGACKSDLSIIV